MLYIYAKMNSKNKKPAKKTASAKKATTKKNDLSEIAPLMAAAADTTTRSRRNAASTIERTDRFKNIDDGLIPFKYSSGSYQNKSSIDVRDAVILCQKAYYNFAVFRNTIDLMTEFSVNSVYFRGGSKKARRFFEALFKKINLWSLQDRFFREYYRSGNVFIYRFDAKIKDQDLKKITQTFGSETLASVFIPSRYVILNPADVRLTGTLSFAEASNYYKVLSPYELQRLRKPQTDEETEFLTSLPQSVQKSLKKNSSSGAMIPLDPEKISAVFYKRQDYEPFSVPMGYPVLEDINAKSEMKKIDMAISRTMQQAILLITMGENPTNGIGIDQKNLVAMQKLFTNESVGRVLVADYTTKAEFVVPSIGSLLDPSKYAILDKDIRVGLNNILVGENEKFANQSIKVKIFIERLKQARETFINEFLFPEMKRICRTLGFKNYPTPYFDDIDLKDSLQYSRIYTRLMELGVLTPEQGITAIERGRLPSDEDLIEQQEEYRKLRDKGFYEPVMGGPHTQKKAQDAALKSKEKAEKSAAPVTQSLPKENGRPEGEQAPQTTKNVSPVGEGDQSKAVETFSLEKVKNNLILAQKLHTDVEKALRAKHDIKRMTNKQKQVAENITELIVANEEPNNWSKNVEKYVDNPVDHNPDRTLIITDLCGTHDVDFYLGSILFASKK